MKLEFFSERAVLVGKHVHLGERYRSDCSPTGEILIQSKQVKYTCNGNMRSVIIEYAF